MHDIRSIRSDPEAFDAALARRGFPASAARLVALDAARRAAMTVAQEKTSLRGTSSSQFGTVQMRLKIAATEAEKLEAAAELDQLRTFVADLKTEIAAAEADATRLNTELDAELAAIPNLAATGVPEGPDETANVVVHVHGTPRAYNFTPLEHDVLGERLGLDFAAAAAMSGARFAVLRGQMARLQRAIGQFMLDVQTREHGYTEIAPPLLVRDEALFGTGQLPKFAEDLFQTTLSSSTDLAYLRRWIETEWIQPEFQSREGETRRNFATSVITGWTNGHPNRRRWLIPTAEVSLTNLVREQILPEKELPLRFAALTPCFRSEAGAAGRDTRGMIRQHQFDKVEMVSITTPDQSEAEHERMTACAEAILGKLGLAYRRMLLCTGDMGFSARKTFDLEVWLPGQGRYREISSCSNCGDFQARRMDARYRPAEGKGTGFVHTLNGSGLAVGRTLVAILETYQQADGSVHIPDALLTYMGGLDRLEPQP